MRILHTSDWHLGRNFHGVNLLDAQVDVLSSLTSIIKDESIDVVVVAGDLFDRSVPSADAVEALSHLLCEIRGAGARIVGISGNHDSPERLGFAESVMSLGGVCIRGDLRLAGSPVEIADPAGGSVQFFPIPYIEPERARHVFETPDLRAHSQLLDVALGRARASLSSSSNRRSVAVVHAFVTGGESCSSELQLSVGGSFEVPLSGLHGFDYVALGHLHGRQSLGKGRARYSGSPMPYSFSEAHHVKGAWIVDLPVEGEARTTAIDLPVHRTLHTLKGDLAQLLRDSELQNAESGFVEVELTDAVLPVDAMVQLRKRFPHAMTLRHVPPACPVSDSFSVRRLSRRDDLQLASDFFRSETGRDATELQLGEIAAAIDTYNSTGIVDDAKRRQRAVA